MYVCEELLRFFPCSVSFLFLSLCSVVHYARDCSCTCMYSGKKNQDEAYNHIYKFLSSPVLLPPFVPPHHIAQLVE